MSDENKTLEEELQEKFNIQYDNTSFRVEQDEDGIIAPAIPKIKPFEPIKYVDDDPGEDAKIDDPYKPSYEILDPVENGKYKYEYAFGIDDIKFNRTEANNTACYISKEIEVGFLGDDEYLQLISEYDEGTNGSVEFYIIDKSIEKPILPINKTRIDNEKIFPGLQTRFIIDNSQGYTIKLNGEPIDKTIDSAIYMNSDDLTIDYVPMEPYNLRPESNVVKVKVILRDYDDIATEGSLAPYVKFIGIKIFRGNGAWMKTT